MTGRKIKGTDMLLFLDPLGGTSYSEIVCLTNSSYARSLNVIDASSKCGDDFLPGDKTRTLSVEGQVVYGNAAGTLAETDLDDLFEDDTTVGWKLAKAAPVAGDVSYAGTGFLTRLDASYPNKEASTFSAEMQIVGVPTKTIAS
jgi:predicted secreted protein